MRVRGIGSIVALIVLFETLSFAQDEDRQPLGLLTTDARNALLGAWARVETEADGAVGDAALAAAATRCQTSMFRSLWQPGDESSAAKKRQMFPAEGWARGDLSIFQTRGTLYLAQSLIAEPFLYHLSNVSMGPAEGGTVIRFFIDGVMLFDAMIPAMGTGFDGLYWTDMTLGEATTPGGPRFMLRGSAAAFLKCEAAG